MSPVAGWAAPSSWPSSASSRTRWRQSSPAYKSDTDFELKLSRVQSADARKLSSADKTGKVETSMNKPTSIRCVNSRGLGRSVQSCSRSGHMFSWTFQLAQHLDLSANGLRRCCCSGYYFPDDQSTDANHPDRNR